MSQRRLVGQGQPDSALNALFSRLWKRWTSVSPDQNISTRDFANGLRVYDPATASLLATYSTNLTNVVPSNNFISNLVFSSGKLFGPGRRGLETAWH